MKIRHLIFLLLFLFQAPITFGQQFSKAEVLSDLAYLRSSLEATHYDPFAYTSKSAFNRNYDAIRKSITKDSMNLLETISLFQQVISKANTGHAEIDFPAQAYREYAMSGGTLFPLELAFEDEKVWIRKNFSTDETLNVGTEVVSIDGQPIAQIIAKIHPQLSAETTYFKNAKLELWSFPRLYWQVFGEQELFSVGIKENGKLRKISLTAVELIKDYEMKREEVLSSKLNLRFYEAAAYLNPDNFSGDEKTYQSFIDSSFVEIRKSGIQRLVIDLRNNAGGHNSFSDYLISYFADKPFKWYSSVTLKSSQLLKEQTRLQQDTTTAYAKTILAHADGETFDYDFGTALPQQESKRFKGEVYVLVNRHSYSMAAVSAALLQDYGFATVVGEKTSDFPTLHASQFQYALPVTGITIKVPKGYIVRPNGSKKKTGVTPDMFIRDHLVDEKDEILEGLFHQLKK